MSSDIPFSKKVKLELNRSVGQYENKVHELRQLFWECTLRCNLSCRHCGSDCRKNEVGSDMPLSDFLKVLDAKPDSLDASRVMIVTTGGEPLLRSDIVSCGSEITKRGFMWGMVSNAMLLNENKLHQLIDAGLVSLGVSYDGFKDDHNWLRGNELSYKNATQAISLLSQSSGLTWDLITCVNKRNIDYLPQFKQYLIDLGVKRWRIFTIVPMGRAVGDEQLLLSDRQFVQLMDFIAETRREARISLNYSCEGFLGRYEGEVRDNFYNCQAGIGVASILNDGSISGCLSIRSNYNQGNIYKNDFWQVWKQGFACYRNRNWMKTKDCNGCEAWRYCRGNGMHLRDENGDLIHCNYLKIKRGS